MGEVANTVVSPDPGADKIYISTSPQHCTQHSTHHCTPLYTTTLEMPPIRRYLRISKYSVLESRIYLENPSDTRWLLNPRDPVLPRIFAAIRPLVLPKLREENERLFARKKGHPVKDVIVEGSLQVLCYV